MGDLHSIAYSYSSNSLALDIQNLPCFNTDISDYSCMETDKGSHELIYDESVLDSDQSSGYLEDALFEFRPKRRRITLTHDDRDHDQGVMSNYQMNDQSRENLSGENSSSCTDTTTATPSNHTNRNLFSADKKETLSSSDHIITGETEVEKKKVAKTKVVYPFVLVKPGGYKGDMTLNDINQRILMPPTRPLRHPVGDFACRPSVSSLYTPGLSGKVVVALTRIQTHQRGGTITIIRTKN